MLVELKCALEVDLEQYVMTSGLIKEHQWSAGNLAFLDMVYTILILCVNSIYYVCFWMVLGAIALNDAQFAEENHPISINSLNCFGNEESIMSCSINEDNSGSCGRFEDAGVVCQGIAIIIVMTYSDAFPYYRTRKYNPCQLLNRQCEAC